MSLYKSALVCVASAMMFLSSPASADEPFAVTPSGATEAYFDLGIVDTSDLLAKALRADVAFVPGQAAYVDGRGGSSMRLNFSGVSEAEIREGIRRIGNVIAEQVELYEALTGEQTEAPAPSARAQASDDANVLPFRKAAEGGT